MSENTTEPRGLSAAQARRPVKRAKQPSTRSEPRKFTIRKGENIVLEDAALKDVHALFPKLRAGLITKRLDGGEREYDRLARPPENTASRKRQMNGIAMYRRSR